MLWYPKWKFISHQTSLFFDFPRFFAFLSLVCPWRHEIFSINLKYCSDTCHDYTFQHVVCRFDGKLSFKYVNCTSGIFNAFMHSNLEDWNGHYHLSDIFRGLKVANSFAAPRYICSSKLIQRLMMMMHSYLLLDTTKSNQKNQSWIQVAPKNIIRSLVMAISKPLFILK
jgi:hypothetical protein